MTILSCSDEEFVRLFVTQLGWRQLVGECQASNHFSMNNFRKAGFDMTDPEQKWGAPDSVYWVKEIS